jgi:hypothetical protein
MDILPLLIAKSLSKTPFAINQDGMEKRPQAEPELAAIDFALLSKVTREAKQSDRSRGAFAGRPATATRELNPRKLRTEKRRFRPGEAARITVGRAQARPLIEKEYLR